MDKKKHALALLREHDLLEARLRVLKRETQKAVTDYGVSQGIWGLDINKFRLQQQMGQERKEKCA